MEIPTSKVATDKLLLLGSYHLTALRRVPEVAALAASFAPLHEALFNAGAARRAADQGLVEPRVNLLFAEAALDAVIRETAAQAHILDGHSSGPVFDAIFPNGLDAEVGPRSAAQVATTRALITRLESSGVAASLRESHLGRLRTANDALAAAVAVRDASLEAQGVAIGREQGAREDFVRAYDANAGIIRSRYPKDRRRQDLFFDTLRKPTGSENDPEPTPNT